MKLVVAAVSILHLFEACWQCCLPVRHDAQPRPRRPFRSDIAWAPSASRASSSLNLLCSTTLDLFDPEIGKSNTPIWDVHGDGVGLDGGYSNHGDKQ